MNKKVQKRKNSKNLLFYFIMILIPVFTISTVAGGYFLYKTMRFYNGLKSSSRGWYGKVHKGDPVLGMVPIPDSRGEHLFPIGSSVPMRYGEEGFRVPVTDYKENQSSGPTLLSLGCSFTYGDAVLAEDTFPWLLGKALNGNMKNGGVCSYGLAQMLLLAKKLVPIYKPEYLIVQYSPWLIDRATLPFAPSHHGKITNPFFFEDQGFKIHPPVFQSIVFDLPTDHYKNTPKSFLDLVSFIWNVSMPLAVHDSIKMSRYSIKKSIGIIPKPTTSHQELVDYVYQQFYKICMENGSQLVIAIVGKGAKLLPIPESFSQIDAIVVNTQKSLLEPLPTKDIKTYRKHYVHWRGSPPRVVDGHPNEKAHGIIAEAIVSKIGENHEKDLK